MRLCWIFLIAIVILGCNTDPLSMRDPSSIAEERIRNDHIFKASGGHNLSLISEEHKQYGDVYRFSYDVLDNTVESIEATVIVKDGKAVNYSYNEVDKIHDFVSCSKKHEVMYPDCIGCLPYCETPDGMRYEEPPKDERLSCVDLCGDGICQEIVCMGIDCPCAENADGCPLDC